jgi:hypothetical protein
MSANSDGAVAASAAAGSSGDDGRPRGRVVAIEGVRAVLAAPVRCGECAHFRPGRVTVLGHCAAGQAEPTARLWAKDPRGCSTFVATDLAQAVRAMAERWQYLPDELEWALQQAAREPAGWWRMIEADLRTRRWPGAVATSEPHAARHGEQSAGGRG